MKEKVAIKAEFKPPSLHSPPGNQQKMVLPSAFLMLVLARLSCCRTATRDINNDISIAGNLPYREQTEWVKISGEPAPIVKKFVGSYVELECEAMGSPLPSLRWFRGKTPLTEHTVFDANFITEVPFQSMGKIVGRLVINYLLPLHSGTFTCVAESGSKIATADTTLYAIKNEGFERNYTQLLATKILGVHHVPRISLWAPMYMNVISANVVLPCRTFGNPKPSQIWTDPEGRAVGENDGRVGVLPDGSLSIRALGWEDMGVYKCLVRNMVGEDSAETFIYPMKESK